VNRLQEIIEEIKILERELVAEIQKKEEEFFYKVKGRNVSFEETVKEYHKKFAIKIRTYLYTSSLLNILVLPVIWSCLIPAVFLDVVISVYQGICFKVYGIPEVKRSEYIVIDHESLSYLNAIEKINCLYCGYFNGLIAYVQEIAARTEQYWCPIKHARKLKTIHSRYGKFFEYGDCEEYRRKLEEVRRDFKDLQDNQ
jgi:hypothetical protein